MKRTFGSTNEKDKVEGKKRAKSGQACTACRRNKTRCDLPSNPTEYICHRCKTLGLECSFLELDPSNRATTLNSNGPSNPRVLVVVSSAANGAAAVPSPPPSVPNPLSFDASTLRFNDLVEGSLATLDERTRTQQAIQSPMTAMYELIRRQFLSITSSSETYDAVNVVLEETEITHLLQQ
jgi:hypothetical protein